MSHQPNDGFQPPPFTRRTSPDRATFDETFLVEAAATASQSKRSPSPHSPKVKSEPNSVERPHAPDAAPHSLPVTSKPSQDPSFQPPTSFTRFSSQISESGPGQRNKRSYYLIDHEEDNEVKPYDPATEPLPKKEVNHKSFDEAERLANGIPEEILSVIDEQGCRNEDIDYIIDIAKNASSPNYPTGVKIGLRGNSGTGKSSIINSLLGIPNIAPQSDDGAACTSVVQEFHKPRPNQQNACEADIFFLTPPARMVILKEWLRDVYIFEHSGAEPGDDVFEKFEQASSTAIEGLFSLFCDRDECQSHEAIQKFLSGARSQNDVGMLSRLQGWMDELLNNLGSSPGKVFLRDTSPEMIQHQTARYLQHEETYDSSGRLTPSPWPVVKLVKTYFDSPILSQDIVLVDLPGTSDVNQTRVRASQQYLNDVDYIGVVTKVDRVETDVDTHRYLIDAFRRKRGASVLMIATGSDSVNMKPTYLNKRISTAEPLDAANLTTLKDEFDMTSLELQKVSKELNVARSRKDRNAIEGLTEEKESLEYQKVSLLAKLSEYCVQMRNTNTSRNVRQKYYDLTKDPVQLPMFCVSNAEYTTHAIGYDKKYPPMMGVSATGIPELRAFLYSLPAVRKFRVFEHHRKMVLPSLLNNLELTCSQTKLMRRDELHRILLSASLPLAESIQKIFESFFTSDIVPGIASIKVNKATYAEYAKGQLRQWTEWTNATHKAFCSHNGNWSTKKVGRHDWNNVMLEPLIKDVEKDMRGWDDASTALALTLSDNVCATVTDLISQLEGAAGSSKNSMKLYFEELTMKKDLLSLKSQSRVEQLEKDLGVIKEKITNTNDSDECYFVKIMEDTYQECCTITGSRAREMRTDRLKSKLSEKVRGPFQELFNQAKTASQKAIQKHAKEFTQEVKDTFAGFNLTFMHSFKTDEADTPEVKELREMLRARVSHWRNLLTEDIDKHLAICRKYAASG